MQLELVILPFVYPFTTSPYCLVIVFYLDGNPKDRFSYHDEHSPLTYYRHILCLFQSSCLHLDNQTSHCAKMNFEFPTIRAELVHSLPGVDINQLEVEGWRRSF